MKPARAPKNTDSDSEDGSEEGLGLRRQKSRVFVSLFLIFSVISVVLSAVFLWPYKALEGLVMLSAAILMACNFLFQ